MKLKIPEAMDLAALHHRQERYAEAKAVYEAIVKAEPDNARALHQLARVARDLGKPEIALNFLLQAIDKDEDLLDAYLDVIDVNFTLENLDGVVEAAEFALGIDPGNMRALLDLGNALLQQGRFEEAVAAMRKRVELQPHDAQTHFHLGRALAEHGHLDDAVAAYKRTLRITPNLPGALNNLATIYEEQGNDARAMSLFRQTIKRNSRAVKAHYGLALAKPFAPGDPRIEELKGLLAKANLDDGERGYALYGLAYGYDAIGAYDEAFACFKEANETRAETFPYHGDHAEQYIDDIIAADTAMAPGLCAEPSGESVPVFIIGLSRSGKSLVESLVAHSPQVLDGRERAFFRQSIKKVAQDASLGGYPDALPKLDPTHLSAIARLYREHFAGFVRSGESHFINTSPLNYQYVGMILRCFPNAKIVYCQREVLDHALYIYFKRYEDWHSYSYFLGDVANNIALSRRIMDYWRRTYGEDRILPVQYEDLVSKPRPMLRAITDFLGIEPLPAKVTEKVHAKEVGHWRYYEKYLGELRDQMSEYGDQESEEPKRAAR